MKRNLRKYSIFTKETEIDEPIDDDSYFLFFFHARDCIFFPLFFQFSFWNHEKGMIFLWHLEKLVEKSTEIPTIIPMNIQKPKIAVLHDSFLYRGGGERLVTLMAKSLDADLIAGFFSEGSLDPRELGFTGKIIQLGKPVLVKWVRHLTLFRRFKNARILAEYDIVILSGNCLDALQNIRKDAKKIYYCHTPPRYLFDFRPRYMATFPSFSREIIGIFFDKQAKQYISQLSDLDLIFTNSQNTHDRLLDFCHQESVILYPPTDTSRFAPSSTQDMSHHPHSRLPSEYYLSFSRLSPPKRVDMVVDAFLQMPEKNLVFTYGQNDPMKDEILEKCKNARNIFPLPAPSDAEFIELVQGAIANIYIPVDEDFGMSPVESMACGVPVIGVDEWGLKETIIEGKTGYFLPKNITVEDIIAWVRKMTPAVAFSMREDSVARAHDFQVSV